jgi:hypothetical protein
VTFGYTDPYEAAREVQQRVQPGAYPPGSPGVPQGPLADLQNQVAGVLNGADSHHVYLPGPDGSMLTYPRGRQPSVAGAMLKGALLGVGSVVVWRGMKRRRVQKGEFTSPGFRALGLLLVFPAIGFALSMLWVAESGYFLGWGCALGIASFTVYAVYRATGHGNFNTRRRGSPWRSDHRSS